MRTKRYCGVLSVRIGGLTTNCGLVAERGLLAVVVVFACRGGSDQGAYSASESASSTAGAVSHLTVVGDSLRLIQHDENLPAGFPLNITPVTVSNPHEGDKEALRTGAQLFIAYNCLDCHGAEGSGAMGPSFQDGRWHFGGSPGQVFESIYQGRPDGMPAWGGRISNDQIWMLTAYVRSLSSKDLSTENFTGKTVERTGH